MSSPLVQKSCVPCHGGVPPLRGEAVRELQRQVPGWEVMGENRLHRVFAFPDFAQALAFVNRIGEVAEREGHHPDLGLGWGRVDVTTYTHAVGGLTESDFILAAKIDALPR